MARQLTKELGTLREKGVIPPDEPADGDEPLDPTDPA